jgi:hypothetical protein
MTAFLQLSPTDFVRGERITTVFAQSLTEKEPFRRDDITVTLGMDLQGIRSRGESVTVPAWKYQVMPEYRAAFDSWFAEQVSSGDFVEISRFVAVRRSAVVCVSFNKRKGSDELSSLSFTLDHGDSRSFEARHLVRPGAELVRSLTLQ